MVYVIIDDRKKIEVKKKRMGAFGEERIQLYVQNGSEKKLHLPDIKEIFAVSFGNNEDDLITMNLDSSLELIASRDSFFASRYRTISRLLSYYDNNSTNDRLYIIPEMPVEKFLNPIKRITRDAFPIHYTTLADFVRAYESFRSMHK
jgi:hypothetical protein